MVIGWLSFFRMIIDGKVAKKVSKWLIDLVQLSTLNILGISIL